MLSSCLLVDIYMEKLVALTYLLRSKYGEDYLLFLSLIILSNVIIVGVTIKPATVKRLHG